MKHLLSVFILCGLLTACSEKKNEQSLDINAQLDYCAVQVNKALNELHRPDSTFDFTMEPRNILDGEYSWNCRKASAEEWCSGFWPGILWMTYGVKKDERIRRAAEGYTNSLSFLAKQPVYDHDLGFLVINSFLKGYEQTQDERYRDIALAAADSLATLFRPQVGTLLSWPRNVAMFGGHNTIMDNMINLELLLWAAADVKNPPAKREQLRNIAISHADTTMRYQFRPDGSCYHVAVYDTLSGAFIKGVTHQGLADSSMWSRGQAWAIYGYTMVYRYTHEERFLRQAQKAVDIYLRRLAETSDDMVPIWDMDAPRKQKAPKDASAACVVASALLELCHYVDEERGMSYRQTALAMLRDLSTDRYQSRDRNVSFLLHSTGHHPAGSEIDASIIYADYYYLEALLRAKWARK